MPKECLQEILVIILKRFIGFDLSAESVSKITETIMEQAKEWQARPLDSVYPFLFLDAVHYSVRTNGKVVKKSSLCNIRNKFRRKKRMSLVSI